MLRKIISIVSILFSFIICGCSSERAPSFIKQEIQGLKLQASGDSTATWALDSLRPAELTVLVHGQTNAVSVAMVATCSGNYRLELWANGKRFRAFKLLLIQTALSQTKFSGKVSWFLKVRGKTETVIVRLYKIEEMPDGDTQIKTLLKEIKRNYNVVCNNHEPAIILFLQKHVFCSCKTAVVQSKIISGK